MTIDGTDIRATAGRGGTAAALACAALGLALVGPPAGAQTLNDLTGALGKSAGSLGGAGLPSVDQASPSNLAGVLQYCLKNQFLGGGDAQSVEQSLMGKLGGSDAAAKDEGFQAGSSGLLQTGGGDTFGLGGEGLQQKLTDQVCDLVLSHAQSLL